MHKRTFFEDSEMSPYLLKEEEDEWLDEEEYDLDEDEDDVEDDEDYEIEFEPEDE